MTQVLLVSYHFPPIGGAAVQRAVQLCRHLPEFGFEMTVLTGPGAPEYRWSPLDGSLLAEGTTVLRVPPPEPSHTRKWWNRAERWLRVKSPWQRWWEAGVAHRAMGAGRRADVVYASVAPYQTGASAADLARSLGLPLIVDLEDPWALDEMASYPSRLHRHLDLRGMRRVLEQAAVVVMNTEEAARALRRTLPQLSHRRVLAIPNRYERATFESTPLRRTDGRFRIVHTGSLHTDSGLALRRNSRLQRLLGGTYPGVDFLSRSHVYLLEALEQLGVTRPDIAAHVEAHFAGVFTEQDLAVARRSRFARMHEFMPHREAAQLISSADLLFLPMHDPGAGSRARIVPQKTYEYLGASRPILAAVPEGDARDVLRASGVARVCGPSDVDGMIQHLKEAVEAWLAAMPPPKPDPDVLRRYEARQLAEEVAEVINQVVVR